METSAAAAASRSAGPKTSDYRLGKGPQQESAHRRIGARADVMKVRFWLFAAVVPQQLSNLKTVSRQVNSTNHISRFSCAFSQIGHFIGLACAVAFSVVYLRSARIGLC